MKSNHRLMSALAAIIFIASISSIVLFGCGNSGKNGVDNAAAVNIPEVKPFEGYRAPDFELEDLSGKKVKLSSLFGKTLVINFWSLDCPFCLSEMPELDSFISSKPADVELLTVNLDPDQKELSAYMKKNGHRFIVLKDAAAKTLRSYFIRGVPTTIVIGKDGIITARVEGPVTRQILGELVKTSPSDRTSTPSCPAL